MDDGEDNDECLPLSAEDVERLAPPARLGAYYQQATSWNSTSWNSTSNRTSFSPSVRSGVEMTEATALRGDLNNSTSIRQLDGFNDPKQKTTNTRRSSTPFQVVTSPAFYWFACFAVAFFLLVWVADCIPAPRSTAQPQQGHHHPPYE